MEIKYLKVLEENPNYTCSSGFVKTLQPITIKEISALEIKYNGGNPFPIVLKELLYLAGDYCYVMDYGAADSQDDIQQIAREYLADNSREISRPFYVVDMYGGSQFLFVYVDEPIDDPKIYEAQPYDKSSLSTEVLSRATGQTLASLIEGRTNSLLQGYNPF